MVYVSRREHFNAAHKLYNPNWSPEQNKEVFGPCANEYYHGHNFEIVITVKGKPDPQTGFVLDMKVLGSIMKKEIIEKLDHRNINMEVEFMQGKMASCEILVMEIWNIMERELAKVTEAKMHCIKLIETPKNFVEYYG